MTTFKGIDEQDYINVSELACVRIAKEVLSKILPDNSEVIGKLDHKHMMIILSKWEEDLYKKIIIK